MPAERNVKIRRTSGRSFRKNPDWNASDDNTAHFRLSPDSSPADHNAPSAYTWKLPNPASQAASSSYSLDHHVKCQFPSIHTQIQLSSSNQPSLSSSIPSSSSPAFPNLTSVFRAGGRRSDPHRISRPRNAFIVFRSFYVKWHRNAAASGKLAPNDPFFKIYTKSPTLPPNQNELSKIAGKVWNVMTELEKRPFCIQASRERAQHRRMYPEFAYTSNVGGGTRKPGKGKGKCKRTEPLPSPTISPSFGTSELPLLELPQQGGEVERCKQEEQLFPLFASDIPSFTDHIDIPAFGIYEYSDCAQDPTLPPLPTTISEDVHFDPMYAYPIDFSLAYPEPPSYAPTFNDDNSKLHIDYVTYSRPEASYLQNDGAGYTFGNLSVTHGESTDALFDFSAFASVDFQVS